MTGMVTVRLLLYGLIAFVPDSNTSPTAYNALLVDARGPQYASDGCRIPPHVPALYVSAGQCKANGAACTLSAKVEKPRAPALSGSWLLDRESLSVEVVEPRGKRTRKLITVQGGKMASALPSTAEESSSLRWIPEMQTLVASGKANVDPDCLGAAQNCPVAARLVINDGRFTSCHLAQEPEKEKIYPYEFKGLNATSNSAVVQALSDAVMVTLQVPKGSTVKIVSQDLAATDSERPKRTIVLKAGSQKTIDVWLTNVPKHQHLMAGDACDEASMSVDRHFELYYNLLSDRIPFSQRVVPYRRITQEVEAVISQVQQPEGEDRCPLLTFLQHSNSVPIENRTANFRAQGGFRYPTDLRSCGNIQLSPPTSSSPASAPGSN